MFKATDHLVVTNSLTDKVLDIGHMDNCIWFGLGWLLRVYKGKVESFVVNQYAMFVVLIGAFICTIYGLSGRYVALIWIILMLNIADTLTTNNLATYWIKIGKETKFIYLVHPFLGMKVSAIGMWLLGIKGNGLMTNFVIQLVIAVPITIMMIWISMKIAMIMKQQHFTSFILYGEWNYIDDLRNKKNKR